MQALCVRCRPSGPLLVDPTDGLVPAVFALTLSYICASALLEIIVSLSSESVPAKNHRCQMLSFTIASCHLSTLRFAGRASNLEFSHLTNVVINAGL
jgi:hypothetical protein